MKQSLLHLMNTRSRMLCIPVLHCVSTWHSSSGRFAYCQIYLPVFHCQVGGEFFDTIIPLLNLGGRVSMCGQISSYNKTEQDLGMHCANYSMDSCICHTCCFNFFLL